LSKAHYISKHFIHTHFTSYICIAQVAFIFIHMLLYFGKKTGTVGVGMAALVSQISLSGDNLVTITLCSYGKNIV